VVDTVAADMEEVVAVDIITTTGVAEDTMIIILAEEAVEVIQVEEEVVIQVEDAVVIQVAVAMVAAETMETIILAEDMADHTRNASKPISNSFYYIRYDLRINLDIIPLLRSLLISPQIRLIVQLSITSIESISH